MKSMNKEVSLILEELLNNEAFQKALNIASQQIGMPIDQFNDLKEHLPDNAPWTLENVNVALQNYRANIIVETRKTLTDLSKYLKGRSIQELLIDPTTTRTTLTDENKNQEQT